MPSIDLARLRKQCARLADFFFVPDEFARQLHAVLDSYVNYTRRRAQAAAPGIKLPSHETPPVVLRQIEMELAPRTGAQANTGAALVLAERLWAEGSLEGRLLAAFILGRMPPDAEGLTARLSEWIAITRDPELRQRLLDHGLARIRKERRGRFLELLAGWLSPGQSAHWGDAVRAATAAVRDPAFTELPPLLKVVDPALRVSPPQFQLEVEELLGALYEASPSETTYYVRQILGGSMDRTIASHFRRMAPALPAELRSTIQDCTRGMRPSGSQARDHSPRS